MVVDETEAALRAVDETQAALRAVVGAAAGLVARAAPYTPSDKIVLEWWLVAPDDYMALHRALVALDDTRPTGEGEDETGPSPWQ